MGTPLLNGSFSPLSQEQDRLEEVRARQLAWAENLKSKHSKLDNVKLPKPQKEAASIK
jgi:hypothetical protein